MTDPVTQIEQGEQRNEGADTKTRAARMASIIAEGMGVKPAVEGQPAPTTTGVAPAPVQEAVVEGEQPVVQPAAGAAAAAPAAEAEPIEEVVDIGEVERVLAQAGIDLGINSTEIPAELLPVYDRLVRSAVDVAEAAMSERMQATESVRQVEEFSRQLEEQPDRLLLALALNRPEAFQKAIEVFGEMQQDARVKEMVVKELQSEARLREAERKERLMDEYSKRTKAGQVIAATKRAARVQNVPYSLAEKVVALAVQANGGDLDVGEVDGIVGDLAGELTGRKPAAKLRIATPGKAAAVRTAPTNEVGAGTATPTATPAKPGISKGLTEATPHQRIKGIVSAALAKLRTEQQ